MSTLESDVIPLLEPMLRGQPTTLDETKQRLLATWALKTAMTYQLTAPSGIAGTIIPQSQYRYLQENLRPPDDVCIWIGSIDLRSPTHRAMFFDAIQLFVALLNRQGPAPPDTRTETYLVTFSIEQVAIQIFGVGLGIVHEFRNLGAWERYLNRIWPLTAGTTNWPPDLVLLADQREVLSRRFGAPLGLTPPQSL